MQTDIETLAQLLLEQGFEADSRVATAVNGAFIARHTRATYMICDGDQVEVVAPMQGLSLIHI